MKENQNQKTAVCPACGCEHPIKDEGYLFKEEWENGLKKFAHNMCGLSNVRMTPDGSLICSIFDGVRIRRKEVSPVPKVLVEWLNANPCPKLDRDQFITFLGVRVSVLETALAVKGGAR